MRFTFACLILTSVACGRPRASDENDKTPTRYLVLEAVGPVAHRVYPQDSAILKVAVFETAGSNIDSENDLQRKSGVAVAWSAPTNGVAVSLSSFATITDENGIAEIAVTASDEVGMTQVTAVTSGADPVTFTVQVLTDARQLELLTPGTMSAPVGTTETLRARLVRPSEGGGAALPIADGIITARLVGGVRNGARLETAAEDEASLVSDAAGVVSVRFYTGSAVDTNYQIEFCGQGTCPGVAAKTVSITARARVTGGGTCEYFWDCDEGYICDSGQCRPAGTYCDEDRDCPTGYACSNDTRLCEPRSGDQCYDDQDCPSGQICGAADLCIDDDGCTSNADCPAGTECHAASGACVPDGSMPTLDVGGAWTTRYHFDLSGVLPSVLSGGLGPLVDFLRLVFANQLEIDTPIIGDALEALIDSLADEYVPAWVPRVADVLADFIHLFENMDAKGRMRLVQSPRVPTLGNQIAGQETWDSATLTIASLCYGGPAEFEEDPSCGTIDIVMEPTFDVSYSNDAPEVGIKQEPFNGEVLGDVLVLNNRSITLELRQLVNVALDLIVATASDGDYYDFEYFLYDIVPCEDVQQAFDDLICRLTDGDVCYVAGIENACEAAASAAAEFLTDMLGQIPVGLELDFQARVLVHDEDGDEVADVLGDPEDPDSNLESSLRGEDDSFIVFGGELDPDSWWYAE